MKTLNELGIAPTPWNPAYVNKPYVYDKNNKCVADCDISFNRRRDDADARLVVAAPDLYEALREIVDEYGCADCACLHDGVCTRPKLKNPECLYKRGREALEKAGGAE